MKPVFFLLLATITLATCKKEDESSNCQSCSIILTNGEAYPYKVTFSNWGSGAPAPFTLQVGATKTFTMPSGKSITINGDFQSPFAHNDFTGVYRCDANCGVISAILQE